MGVIAPSVKLRCPEEHLSAGALLRERDGTSGDEMTECMNRDAEMFGSFATGQPDLALWLPSQTLDHEIRDERGHEIGDEPSRLLTES